MKRSNIAFLLLVVLAAIPLNAQLNAQLSRMWTAAAGNGLTSSVVSNTVASLPLPSIPSANQRSGPVLPAPAALPRMAPELALQAYQYKSAQQSAYLASYSATTLIRAQLPDTSQSGEFELQRHYVTPHSLQFKAVRYTGDGFVKSNVITRLLQSEVDHVRKDDPALSAITSANYKFSYKGATSIEGRPVHVFQVKPHKKRTGLFKGRVYLDAYTGSLVRAEGSVVKSPSFFIKKIEFVQDYAEFDGFTFPVHLHADAKARIIGRAIVDIHYQNYQPVASTVQSAQQLPAL